MGKVILTTNAATATTTANTSNNFFVLGNGWTVRRAVEATSQVIFRTAGTLSKLYARVTANSNVGSVAFKTRKNAANGNQTVTIGAAATGVFEDATNTDTVAAGDKFNYQSPTGGATGTMTYNLMSCIFDSTTNYVSKLVCDGQGLPTASTTYYFPLSGQVSGVTSTEANTQNKVKKAGTLKNFCVSANVNGRTTDTIATMRIGGADTAIVATIIGSTTGFFENTANTASVAVDDLTNSKIVTGTGTGTVTIDNMMIEYETTNGQGLITAGALGSSAELVVNANTTNYVIAGGETRVYATEAEAKLKTRVALTLSNLTIWVPTNGVLLDSTFKMRVNGADGNQTITIPLSTTGYFHDTSNIDVVDDNDEINYQLITGLTGTSMTVRQMAVWSLYNIAVLKTLSETDTIGESIARVKAAIRLLSAETITIGEAVTRIKAAFKALSQSITVGEALGNLIAKTRALATQTIVIAEDVVRVVTPAGGANILKTLSETIIVSEARDRLKAIWRILP